MEKKTKAVNSVRSKIQKVKYIFMFTRNPKSASRIISQTIDILRKVLEIVSLQDLLKVSVPLFVDFSFSVTAQTTDN